MKLLTRALVILGLTAAVAVNAQQGSGDTDVVSADAAAMLKSAKPHMRNG
jgi:hypothetical protein